VQALPRRYDIAQDQENPGRAPLLSPSVVPHIDKDVPVSQVIVHDRPLIGTSPPPIPYNTRPKNRERPCMQVFNAVQGHLNHYEINGNFQQTTEDTGGYLICVLHNTS
jgi:hypothetical protein